MNARTLGWLLGGFGLAAATLLAAWGWVEQAGEPFGNWDWQSLAFVLLALELLALGGIAASSGPFEQRLRRWDIPADPLAIRFQMDLAATEQVSPRRVAIDARPLLLGVPVFLAALALGVTLATRDTTPERRPIEIGEAERIAFEAVRTRGVAVVRHPAGVLLLTAGDARERIAVASLAVASDDDLVYLVYFVPGPDSGSLPITTDEPGPVVVVDAYTGGVVGYGEGSYEPR